MTNVKQYTLNHLHRAAAMLSPFFYSDSNNTILRAYSQTDYQTVFSRSPT